MNNFLSNFLKFFEFFRFSSYYNIYLKNILLYFVPFETKFIFDDNNICFTSLNFFLRFSYQRFLFKINKIEYNNFRFYNYGYCYKTVDNLYNLFDNLDIAFPPDSINSIVIEMSNNNNYQLTINDDDIFITSILPYGTTKSQLHILLYFYLQNYLNNFDIINNVKIEIDDVFYDINHFDTLTNIYNHIEALIE